MATRIKGRKLKDLPASILRKSFVKDFNSTDMNCLSLMNDKTKAETMEKMVVHHYMHRCHSGDKVKVLVVADQKQLKNLHNKATKIPRGLITFSVF